ncbi:ABC transporter ATP-binding protein [Solwaraspora sp. WMMA2080]|uniref:ABC transporter ATP-binding protein n=1 Tax=unclassified Solwaraspora TaxID=2627926 RepID=UPI00248B463B|nr:MULTISPECIES: ABC transporter ATP-binding protein [unclassified Solwaraspora]WBB99944.1 ABC transporter ATP-binding protein [Solwaraspora sp. WMMA2059]WBC21509.1 ABC transporter ATP-binding protein [Solwaraspora sp. WMMA2080]
MAGTGKAHLRDTDDVVLRVEDLTVRFPAGRGRSVQAVSGISLDARVRETVGLVGESGCGKSTTGRAILQLPPPTSGSVRFDGTELTALHGERLRRTRTRLQMIFQDPISSLNPRRTVRDIVAEGLRIWHREGGPAARRRVDEVLDAVGLDPRLVGDRRPHELSGGQCQRVCIARALVLEPAVVLCDEPVSALDVSVQAQILNLLEEMKQRYGLTLLFVAHDLAVVKRVSDRIVVMYLGKICEVAPPDVLFARPAHPYTALLLRSIPELDDGSPAPARTSGELPSALDPPSGCRFRTRCPRAADVCARTEPQLRQTGPDQYVACHFPQDAPADGPTAGRSRP